MASMNVSATPTETAFQGIDAGPVIAGMPWLPEKKAPVAASSPAKGRNSPIRNADVVIASGNLGSLRQSESRDGRRFVGRVVVPGVLSLPEQKFTVRFSKHGFVIKSNPLDSWPQLVIECESTSATQNYTIKDVVWRLSTETVDGWLRHTCVILSLEKAGGFSIEAPSINLAFDVKYDASFESEQSESEQRVALQMAKLIRKLKYIEDCFNVKFRVPDVFSPDEVQRVEIVFRGITEGVFTTRRRDYTFERISSSDIDISKPPFSGPGPFSLRIEPTVSMFGKHLSVGPVTVSLDKAELAGIGLVERLRKRSTTTEKVRFEILDNQITYRFESYARESRKHRVQRLTRFKKELARYEPEEMVALVEESLQGDVSRREASQIAMGWTFYSHLPDRYCPQEPEIDDTTGHWRVPIWLVYASGKGGPVGEVIIDKKTGKIIRHTPIDELRRKGLALAEKILNA
jgi:hypothetical protein